MDLLPLFSFRSRYFIAVWYVTAAILCAGVIWSLGWQFAGFLGVLGIVYPLYMAAGGYALARELRLRGYDWVTFGTGFRLVARFFSKGWRLPPRDQAASIPGYEDTLEGLTRILRRGCDLPDAEEFERLPEVESWIAAHGWLPSPPPQPLRIRLFGTPWCFLVLALVINVPLTLLMMAIGWQYAWVYSLNGIIALPYLLIISALIPGRLLELGYGKVSGREARYLAFRLQHLIWRVPRRDDLQQVLKRDRPIDMVTVCNAILTAESMGR